MAYGRVNVGGKQLIEKIVNIQESTTQLQSSYSVMWEYEDENVISLSSQWNNSKGFLDFNYLGSSSIKYEIQTDLVTEELPGVWLPMMSLDIVKTYDNNIRIIALGKGTVATKIIKGNFKKIILKGYAERGGTATITPNNKLFILKK